VDEFVHGRVARFRRVEQRWVVVAPERLSHPILLFAQRLVEFGLRYLAVADGCDRARAAALTKIVIDAEERERQRDQRENDLNDAFMFVDEVVHGRFGASLLTMEER